MIYFEKLEQLFGKSLVGKTRAKKGDYSFGGHHTISGLKIVKIE